jgi:hypothetical protein
LFFSVPLKAQDGYSAARWPTNKINIDGSNNEWDKPLNLYDDKTGLLFAVANDRQHLFLCFTGKDENKIKKMMRSGWAIEVMSKDKKRKFDASLIFPAVRLLVPEKRDHQQVDELRQKPDFSHQVNIYKLQLSGITAKGFINKNGTLPISDSSGVNIGIGSDDLQKIVYEISIPINELTGTNDIADLPIELKVSVNAMERPNNESGDRGNHRREMEQGEGMEQTRGMRQGGIGAEGMGRGGMTGGRGRGVNDEPVGDQSGGFERSALFEKASFSQKIRFTVR